MALFKKAPAAKAGKKTSDSPIIVAADLPDPDTGAVKYSKEQVVDADQREAPDRGHLRLAAIPPTRC
jgi:hypothetical protein